MNALSINISKDSLVQTAKELGITVVPCLQNKHRVTLLDRGERLESYTENGTDTTIVWHTGARSVEAGFSKLIPAIVDKLIGALNALVETV